MPTTTSTTPNPRTTIVEWGRRRSASTGAVAAGVTTFARPLTTNTMATTPTAPVSTPIIGRSVTTEPPILRGCRRVRRVYRTGVRYTRRRWASTTRTSPGPRSSGGSPTAGRRPGRERGSGGRTTRWPAVPENRRIPATVVTAPHGHITGRPMRHRRSWLGGSVAPGPSGTPSSTATRRSASSTAHHHPRRWPRRRPDWVSRHWPSPTTPGSTASSASPRPLACWACPRSSVPRSRSTRRRPGPDRPIRSAVTC